MFRGFISLLLAATLSSVKGHLSPADYKLHGLEKFGVEGDDVMYAGLMPLKLEDNDNDIHKNKEQQQNKNSNKPQTTMTTNNKKYFRPRSGPASRSTALSDRASPCTSGRVSSHVC